MARLSVPDSVVSSTPLVLPLDSMRRATLPSGQEARATCFWCIMTTSPTFKLQTRSDPLRFCASRSRSAVTYSDEKRFQKCFCNFRTCLTRAEVPTVH